MSPIDLTRRWLARTAILPALVAAVPVASAQEVAKDAPAQAAEADAEDEAPAEANAMQMQAMWSDENFDQWVFGNIGNVRAVRAKMDTLLKLQIDNLDRACTLTEAQKKKLQLAGHGDVKRLFDEVAEKKKKFQLVKNDQNKIGEIFQEIQPLQAKFQSGSFDDGSIFAKAIRKTLDKPQAERYEAVLRERNLYRYRSRVQMAVSMLDSAVSMRADQRAQFEKVILAETQIPKRFGQYDYYVVMYQVAKLPEAKIKPIFDDEQWKMISRQLHQNKGMESYIKGGDYLADEPKPPAVEAGGKVVPAATLTPAAEKKD